MATINYHTPANELIGFLDPAGTVVRTGSSYKIVSTQAESSNWQFVLLGSGFSYDGSGIPASGTVTDIQVLDPDGSLVVQVSGLSAELPAIHEGLLEGASSVFGLLFSGNDTAGGSSGADRLAAYGGGNDSLDGGDGDDVLIGGAGADTLVGGAGFDYADFSHETLGISADLLLGRGFANSSTGDVYRDIEGLIGTAKGDELRGGDRANHLIGNGGIDYLWGGAGADTLDGGGDFDYSRYDNAKSGVLVSLLDAARNTGEAAGDIFLSIEGLYGSGFADTLIGSADHNRLNGENGDDVLEGGGSGDNLNGGAGSDLASYAGASAGIVASLASAAQNTGDAAGDAYDSIEGLIGSAFDDRLTGDSGSNTLIGGAGVDTLDGGAGIDIVSYRTAMSGVRVDLGSTENTDGDVLIGIEGAEGSPFGDSLVAGTADATLKGGNGDDVLYAGSGSDAFDGGAGFDTASWTFSGTGIVINLGTQAFGGGAAGDTARSIEQFHLSGHGDHIVAGASAVTVYAFGGNDVVIGSSESDLLDGGAGIDYLQGGAGNDTYHVDHAADSILEPAEGGYDTVLAGTSFTLSASAAVERLVAASANVKSSLSLTGSNTDNTIVGNAGANQLRGMRGNDGLNGSLGNDKLWGGLGKDVLTGGRGKDIFVFDAKPGRENLDRIADFNVKDDAIWLENKIFKKLGKGTEKKPGKLNKGFFALDTAKDGDDYLVYNRKKGVLFYDADGSGAGKAVEIATLKKALKMTAADFFII